MPTTRKYTFDIDTKRYLNRVNTYRSLSGIPAITNGDAVDIDNFVIGLKDLGIWHITTFWLLRSQYNTGVGSLALHSGGLYSSCNLNIFNLAWSLSGLVKTVSSQYASAPVLSNGGNNSRTVIAIAGNSNLQNHVMSHTSNGSGRFAVKYDNSTSARADIFIINADYGATTIVANTYHQLALSYNRDSGAMLFKVDTAAGTTSTVTANFNPSSLISFGALGISTTAGTGVYSFGMVSNNGLTTIQIDSVFNLVKATIGKGLGLL